MLEKIDREYLASIATSLARMADSMGRLEARLTAPGIVGVLKEMQPLLEQEDIKL